VGWVTKIATRSCVVASPVISMMRQLGVLMRAPPLVHFTIPMLLAACTVGPDFSVPSPPAVQSLTPGPLTDQIAAGKNVQRFVPGRDLPGEWWRLFHCKELTELVDRALRDNHDLKAVQAALRIAHANYRAQQGALYPLVIANLTSAARKPRRRFSPLPHRPEIPSTPCRPPN
jgi:outer membrane protein TolC